MSGCGRPSPTPGTALPPGGVGLLFGGTALYLATFGYTRWTMFHLVSTTRLTAAGVVVLLLVPAAHLPATAALVLLAAVLIALNTVEYLRVDSIGWRALLSRGSSPSGGSGGSGSEP